ncbi:MAG: type I pullulanase [Clostridiales bacterium]|nr:type I pullulanase [Clostridiales bacterium]
MLYSFLENFNQIVIHGIKDYKIRVNRNMKLKIINEDTNIDINKTTLCGNDICICLKQPVDITKTCTVNIDGHLLNVNYSPLYNKDDFNSLYSYDGPLGNIYSKESTEFYIWSPVATRVNLLIFKNGDPAIPEEPSIYPMKKLDRGVFYIKVNCDLDNYYYNYEVNVYGKKNIVVDPYTYAVGINGLRGAIVDLSTTNPEGFESDSYIPLNSNVDAIIYETSVRDFTIHESSNVNCKGKYLGLIEENTKYNNLATGIDHIKEMGITHIQIMPMYDFSYVSVDEKYPIDKYNWGYDPQNYNCPEGSYSINPFSPKSRIKEVKTMIQKFHSLGIAVNMDVVYNHMFEAETTHFENIFPGYYFRRNLDGTLVNGSGCGNDTASEHYMMKRYIIDSIKYWMKEYHVDGFRFDLMGLHDIDTMNKVAQETLKINPNAMIYGEGWNITTGITEDEKAIQINSNKMLNVGFFNDRIRNSVRGSVFEFKEKGFVSGKNGIEEEIKLCIKGLPDLYPSPTQNINYISCHDNHTLWDKLNISNKNDSFDDLKSMHKLAYAIVLTSQGVPFIHSGDEFLRSKNGIENSYNSPDKINKIDWNLKSENIDVVKYLKSLIEFRKKHPAFRMKDKSQIERHIEFLETPNSSIAFIIKDHANGDELKDILVFYNANKTNVKLNLPEGNWYVYVDKNSVYDAPLKLVSGTYEIEPISISILARN